MCVLYYYIYIYHMSVRACTHYVYIAGSSMYSSSLTFPLMVFEMKCDLNYTETRYTYDLNTIIIIF